jgi:hypothetical protein
MIADLPTKFGEITGHTLQRDRVELGKRATDRTESPALWHETETGRQTLADDKQFFTERFEQNLRATRKNGIITITCNIGMKFIAVSYPLKIGDRELTINVGSSSRTMLTILCDYSDRSLAYRAAMNVLEHF